MNSIVVEELPQVDQPLVEDKPALPDKFQGKTPEQIVEMYQNLESTVGRQANEIGHLRKFTDSALGFAREAARPTPPAAVAKPQVTTEDLLANPEGTVMELAKRAANDRAEILEKRLSHTEAQLAVADFSRKYPDFEQTMVDPEFQKWVGESPYRQRLATAAATRGDFDAADELFGLHKTVKAEKPAPAKQADPLEAARRASLTRKGGSSAAGVANTSSDGKKIYSRREMIDLKMNDPDAYNARWETEFYPAHKEGRIRP